MLGRSWVPGGIIYIISHIVWLNDNSVDPDETVAVGLGLNFCSGCLSDHLV